ncbi:Nn.00g089040.m01.CDS01 [Neocucurbitaria sp. VM-36]
MSTDQIPAGDAVDNDYQSRTGQSEIPVQRDEATVESTEYDNGGDSDEQLAKDEKDAINEDNIIDERTRGAAKEAGSYAEPDDEEGLDGYTAGGQDGTSSGRQ